MATSANGDELREDAQRNLRRRSSTDIETHRNAHSPHVLFARPDAAQELPHRIRSTSTSEHADVADTRSQRDFEHRQIVLEVMRQQYRAPSTARAGGWRRAPTACRSAMHRPSGIVRDSPIDRDRR